MIHELPWLPRPTSQDREDLGHITGRAGMEDVARLRVLAARGWNDAELRSVGRRLDKALRHENHEWRAVAQSLGYTPFKLLIFSSRTMSHLIDALRASALRAGIILECRLVEYHEPESWLATENETLASEPPDATLLALDRETLQLAAPVGEPPQAEACLQASLSRYERIAGQIRRLTGKAIIVQTIPPEASDPQVSMDAWLPGAPRWLLAEFTRRLAVIAHERADVIFDVAAIAQLVGTASWDAGRFAYVAKLPFAPACVPLYCDRLVQLIAAMLGKSRRVLVLDLDNTLWNGVIGDDGIDGILLGPGNPQGETHLAIQRMALHYKERGVILCVASKNDEEIAKDAFTRHPDMLLKQEDIALFQINWDDKASNIKAMADALDLGLDAFVFIDDSPIERKQVRDVLPLVAVPELPDDPCDWLTVLQAAAYFEQLGFSIEDKARSRYYQANARRSVQAQTIGDERKFLESLRMEMTVAPFDSLGRARIAQLIAKSNQFNLTTRRYSQAEVAAFENAAGLETLQVRLEDLFGDNGMISVVICRKHARYWDIDTWIMSCRVLGRGVEQAVLGILAQRARAACAQELRGTYIPTGKNGLVREHYRKLGFTKTGETTAGETTWSLQLTEFVPGDVPIATRIRPSTDSTCTPSATMQTSP